ncbi:MAG TPA: hypothetical protein VE398_25020 [Acidobacteriota bacterium]|nr:hypothetical protein [Acidobacteriota bacterium]
MTERERRHLGTRVSILIISSAVVVLCAQVGFADPISLSYTTTSGDSGPGAGVTYGLQLTQDSSVSQLYHGTFTISTAAPINLSDPWYADWVAFKFDGGSAGTISNPSNWSVASNTTMVLWAGGGYRTLLQNTWSGLYAPGITSGTITGGILLTGSILSASFTFDLTMASGSNLNNPIPFQVGYYDGLNGKGAVVFNQLSRDLAVAEPESLVLLGIGLVAVAVLTRRMH